MIILTCLRFIYCLVVDNFPKSHSFFDTLGEASTAVQFLGRENVAISNGEKWRKQRKVSYYVALVMYLIGQSC